MPSGIGNAPFTAPRSFGAIGALQGRAGTAERAG